MTPKRLIQWLTANGWIYKRIGTPWIGRSERINSGDLEHKLFVQQLSDGSEKSRNQCRVTSKGIATISRILELGN